MVEAVIVEVQDREHVAELVPLHAAGKDLVGSLVRGVQERTNDPRAALEMTGHHSGLPMLAHVFHKTVLAWQPLKDLIRGEGSQALVLLLDERLCPEASAILHVTQHGWMMALSLFFVAKIHLSLIHI